MKSKFVIRVLSLAAVASVAAPANAQFCFGYVNSQTLTPMECVNQDLSPGCSWPSNCTSVYDPVVYPATPTQTQPNSVLAMHSEWHNCFGATGGSNPPAGRGARWIAFHRQFELDFDVWRFRNFECDPANSRLLGCAIEYLPWHEGMKFPYGQGPTQAPNSILPGNCGEGGVPRPGFLEGNGQTKEDGVDCSSCRPFPQCFSTACDAATSDPTEPFSCRAGCAGQDTDGTPYDYTSLLDFKSVDEIGRALDVSIHGELHGNVASPFPGSGFNTDSNNANCSPRDPMFWRLHKSLDEMARAWQETQPVDVSIVLDRSGSMAEPDGQGRTKMEVALEAAGMFADVLAEYNAEKGTSNRVGVVSYQTGGDVEVDLDLAENTLTEIESLAPSPGGCTSIGKGLQYGLQQLCPDTVPPGGDETDATCFETPDASDPDSNPRRAMVLLSDGLENVAPCLEPGDGSGVCGSTCSGDPFDFERMGVRTELCAVGFGEGASVNGPLLTLLAERQGGIYMESRDQEDTSDDRWIDLKEFFVKCLGTVTSSHPGIDPKGVLAGSEMQTEVVSYGGCGDTLLNFTSGWDNPEALRLMVNTPSGDLLQHDGSISGSRKDNYEFDVVSLPYNGEQAGEWSSQLIRPHRSYVNGFTTDALNMAVAVPMVRRQIQRLCPEGCQDVVYFEDGHLGPESSYEFALTEELESGLLTSVTTATDETDFATLLDSQSWDLVVYAHQMTQGDIAAYDSQLLSLVCNDQPAIVTDTREAFNSGEFPYTVPLQINECAGAILDGNGAENFTQISGDGMLFQGEHTLTNHGYDRFSYSFDVGSNPEQIAEVQASGDYSALFGAAIVAESDPVNVSGETAVNVSAERWFMNVLVEGPGRVRDWPMVGDLRTAGQGLLANFKIMAANMPPGGFDDVVATVEVERPVMGGGVGQLIEDNWPQSTTPSTTEDFLEGRAAALAANGAIATEIVGPFTLNDDGVDGDLHANNGIWSVQIPSEARVDGAYKLHFKVDLTLNGCTTHREFFRTKFIEVEVDPGSTIVDLQPDGSGGIIAEVDPTDQFGNPWGPGRGTDIECGPAPECQCDAMDNDDGTYTVNIAGAEDCEIIFDGVPVSVSDDPACAQDTEGPSIDVSEEVFISVCSNDVEPVYFEEPEISDNCSHDLAERPYAVKGLIIESNGVPLDPPLPASHHGTHGASLGTHTVEWTATDEWGNTTVAQQTVHVIPAISAGETMLVRDRAVVTNRDIGLAAVANLGAGWTEIGVEAEVGTVDSVAPVAVRDRAVVEGSVSSSGTISLGNNTTISGDVNPLVSLPLPTAPDLSDVVVPAPLGGDHTANSGETLSLVPASYGTVILNSGATLELEHGDYFFQDLVINSDVTAVVTGDTPTLVIVNNFNYRSSFVNPSGNLARVIIGLLGNNYVVLEAPIKTSLVAPEASVALGTGNAMDFFGTFHAKTLEIRPDVELHCSSVLEHHFTPTVPTEADCDNGIQDAGEEGVDCGGSCPTSCPGSCAATSYEAEGMFHSTGGATTDGWNIWANGYISTNHDFAAGTANLTVRARGESAFGTWPHMVVSVGGTVVGDVYVNSAGWADYAFNVTATESSQEIRVAFDNDFYIPGISDRNLLVDKLTVDCP